VTCEECYISSRTAVESKSNRCQIERQSNRRRIQVESKLNCTCNHRITYLLGFRNGRQTSTHGNGQRLEAFEIWMWRRIERTSYTDVEKKVNEDRWIYKLFGNKNTYVLRWDGLLHKIVEGRIIGSQQEEEDFT